MFAMHTVDSIARFLDYFAPPPLAEPWDNVGLLLGDRQAPVSKVMTCLTVTPDSAAEAVEAGAELIVTHHPFPFREWKRATTDTIQGRLLWTLTGARVSVYSPHTAFDSARDGINRRLAQGVGLGEIQVLVPGPPELPEAGGGRWGRLATPKSLADFAAQVKRLLHVEQLQIVGAADKPVSRVAVACGSAGEFLAPARQLGCDCLVTGEVRFHTCLEAEAAGVGLILPGHYATERFAVEDLAAILAGQFAELEVWPSRRERDPLRWI